MGVLPKLLTLIEAFDPRVQMRTRRRLDEVRDATRELRSSLELIDIRTQQLMALERLNWTQRSRVGKLSEVLESQTVRAHVGAAVDRAVVVREPFPHFVVDGWLPPPVYEVVLQAIPPAVFFADKPSHKQQLGVPPQLAPEYCRLVWSFVADFVVGQVFGPAVVRKLAGALDEYIGTFCPDSLSDWRTETRMHVSDGRLMVRRPGYLVEPHRDPRWGFITCLAYLARQGDQEVAAYGTQLYRVRTHQEPPDESAFYVSKAQCELVKTVPFLANKVLVFINSQGAHGASIPADAVPADLERYIYQFRIGPDPQGVRWLLDRMPDVQRKLWVGLKTERAGY